MRGFIGAVMLATIGLAAAPARAQQITSFSDTLGEHVFYMDTSNHVMQLYWNASSWVAQDLTLMSATTTLAAAPNRLSSFSDMEGEHVFYMGAGFHIYQLFAPWGGSWVNQDLTLLSKATNIADGYFGASAAFSDNSGEHVFYVGSNNHIYQIYWPWNGSWVNQDLTANAGGLPDYDGNLAGFADAAGEHVFYFDDNLHQVHQLYWQWGATKWVDQNLTMVAGSSASPTGIGVSAFYDAWGEHAIYPVNDAGVVHLDQLYLGSGGGGWANQDLTAWDGGHAALNATSLTSIVDVMGESVYYFDTNSHVNQLFARANWSNEDLTQVSGATVAAYSTCPGWLTSFSDETGDHVFYIGNADLNAHMLYRNGSSTVWADTNLTAGLPASQQPWAFACLALLQ
jgi:hypothetical protein